jgi:very-short-patch-repair endonuclease
LLQKRNIDGEKTSISRVIALQPPLVILELCHMPRPIQYKLARENRNAPTPAESLLWSHLRNRKTNGWKFLRQHPIKFSHHQHENQFYIVDFYCHEKKLILELDGDAHDAQTEYDRGRDFLLNELGFKVIRFRNEQVLYEIESVIKSIQS